MANKTIFQQNQNLAPEANTKNNAGGLAYLFEHKHALAQIASTNCFNGTYYASADNNFILAKEAIDSLKDDPIFLAKAAIYCRSKSHMKDMPVYILVKLCRILSEKAKTAKNTAKAVELFHRTFDRVVNDGKSLRNFCQILRADQDGKKLNFNGMVRTAIRRWFNNHSAEQIFRSSVGQEFPITKILKLVHPKPENSEKNSLYAWLLEKEYNSAELPAVLQEFEAFKSDLSQPLPAVDFRMLTALPLESRHWKSIARNMPWAATRINLNTFFRNGVFEDREMVRLISERLSNKEEILRAKQFPYQMFVACKQLDASAPKEVHIAMQEALNISLDNVPEIQGDLHIAIDVSGSMSSPITGFRGTATTSVRCVDAAALFGSALLRKNRLANLMPFDTSLRNVSLNPFDSVFTNANKLASLCGGGTNCSLPLQHLNSENAKGDAVIYVSDCESWVDSSSHRGTGMMAQWLNFKKRNKQAKLICIDLTPRNNSQVKADKDILMIGGFSDNVFDVCNAFINGNTESSSDHWVSEIEKVEI